MSNFGCVDGSPGCVSLAPEPSPPVSRLPSLESGPPPSRESGLLPSPVAPDVSVLPALARLFTPFEAPSLERSPHPVARNRDNHVPADKRVNLAPVRCVAVHRWDTALAHRGPPSWRFSIRATRGAMESPPAIPEARAGRTRSSCARLRRAIRSNATSDGASPSAAEGRRELDVVADVGRSPVGHPGGMAPSNHP